MNNSGNIDWFDDKWDYPDNTSTDWRSIYSAEARAIAEAETARLKRLIEDHARRRAWAASWRQRLYGSASTPPR